MGDHDSSAVLHITISDGHITHIAAGLYQIFPMTLRLGTAEDEYSCTVHWATF